MDMMNFTLVSSVYSTHSSFAADGS